MQCLGKKGDSSIIGYVLLIVLAIGMAGAVYSYLKFYLPKEQTSCPQDVHLVIESATCEDGKFDIRLRNGGFFSVDGVYIKIGKNGSAYKDVVNCPKPEGNSLSDCDLYFMNDQLDTPLEPGESVDKSYPYNYEIAGKFELELDPMVLVESKPTICKNAIITQEIICTKPST